MKIKAILFDLGGVLLNIDYHAPARAFATLGIQNFEQLYAQAAQTHIFDDLECGNISNNDFFDAVRTLAQQPLSNAQITWAWNAILLDLPIERLELLKTLRKKYKILLLSNTNAIHIEQFYANLQQTHGIANGLTDFFDTIYLSHQIRKRKPNADAFEFMLNNENLQAHEVLYIEDSAQHTAAAAKLGIHTILHQSNTPLDATQWGL
jgi:putative hydrolase of the HAD superfamily